MPSRGVSSVCCSGLHVEFYWAYHAGGTLEDHIDRAVDELWMAVRKPGARGWHPVAKASARGEFRDRLQAAVAGELQPPDELKPLRGGRPPLHEIRWQHIAVTEIDENGRPTLHHDVCVRLIHAEPDALGVCAVGLHAHEKAVIEGDEAATKAAQDAEIDVAAELYRDGAGELWGLSPR